jgi:hypothetical protein
MDFAKEVGLPPLHFITSFANIITDFGQFVVPAALFKMLVTSTQPEHQWIRVMYLSWLYAADWDKECIRIHNKLQPTCVKQSALDHLKTWSKADRERLEQLLAKIMDMYWLSMQGALATHGSYLLEGCGMLLRKTANKNNVLLLLCRNRGAHCKVRAYIAEEARRARVRAEGCSVRGPGVG